MFSVVGHLEPLIRLLFIRVGTDLIQCRDPILLIHVLIQIL